MFSSIRALLFVTAIAGVMTLLSPVAHAQIIITRAEVQWSDAVVMGRGAGENATIKWEGKSFTAESFEANKRGKFSFRGAVPSDCKGTLSTNFPDIASIDFDLDNCTSDSGDPGDPPGSILPLEVVAMAEDAHNGESVRAVGFASDGNEGTWVISGGEDTFLRRWNWTPGNPVLNPDSFEELDHTIYDLEVSADGSIVVTGEGGWNGGPGSNTLRILDAISFEELLGTTAPIGFVYCVAISPDPDNLWVVASGFYGEIVVYGPSSLELSTTKKTKKKRTKALAFSPDGATLASTSTAGRIQLWSFKCDTDTEPCEPELLPVSVSMSHGGSWVFPIAFAPYSESNFTEIVSGSDGGTIKVWTINLTEPPTVVSVLPVASGAVYSLDWWSPENPEDSMIVAGGDGDFTVYKADTMQILFRTVNAHAGRVNDVAFSPDGDWIVSGGADGALKLWYLGAQ